MGSIWLEFPSDQPYLAQLKISASLCMYDYRYQTKKINSEQTFFRFVIKIYHFEPFPSPEVFPPPN